MRISVVIALSFLVLAPSSARALRLSFAVSTLPGHGQILGRDVNASGDVVGRVDTLAGGMPAPAGFVREGGAFDVIVHPDADALNGTEANGLNDAGLIVGRYKDRNTTLSRGFVLDGGNLQPFDVPGSYHTDARDVNNHGVIVGRTFLNEGPTIGTAFMRIGDDYTFFRPAEVWGFYGISFEGVNDLGNTVGIVLDATGFRAFAVLDGVYMPFSIPGKTGTTALGINNGNQIVGSFDDSTGTHGFLMDATGIYQIDAPASSSHQTYLDGINEQGVLVGAIGVNGFPSRELLVASPCAELSATCLEMPRIGDPVIQFVPEASTAILSALGLTLLGARRGGRARRA